MALADTFAERAYPQRLGHIGGAGFSDCAGGHIGLFAGRLELAQMPSGANGVAHEGSRPRTPAYYWPYGPTIDASKSLVFSANRKL